MEISTKLLVRLSVGLILALVAFSSCSVVNTGMVGVVRHFGAVQPYSLPEGVHFTRPWPFASVSGVNVQTGATETEAAGASKDLQAVHTKITLQWSVSATMAPALVQSFGDHDGAWTGGIVNPAVQEVVKAVSARYTAEHLITQRAQVKTEIETGLNEFIAKTLKQRGCAGSIKIANVAVTNFEFSKEFNASIEAKVKAEQDSLRAENEKKTRITQAEAKAREVTLAAEANAESEKLRADANAYAIEAESKSRSAAIKREAEALSAHPGLVELRIAERWDGKLPTYTGNSIPLLQLK